MLPISFSTAIQTLPPSNINHISSKDASPDGHVTANYKAGKGQGRGIGDAAAQSDMVYYSVPPLSDTFQGYMRGHTSVRSSDVVYVNVSLD